MSFDIRWSELDLEGYKTSYRLRKEIDSNGVSLNVETTHNLVSRVETEGTTRYSLWFTTSDWNNFQYLIQKLRLRPPWVPGQDTGHGHPGWVYGSSPPQYFMQWGYYFLRKGKSTKGMNTWLVQFQTYIDAKEQNRFIVPIDRFLVEGEVTEPNYTAVSRRLDLLRD